jgi:hypothetical protein
MMRITSFITTIFTLLLFLVACMKHEPYTKSCVLSTGVRNLHTPGQVIYRLTHTGSVLVDSLTYQGVHGPVTVVRPKLPFVLTIDVAAGSTVGLTAHGTSFNGSFSIEYALGISSDTLRGRDVCSR